MYLQEHNMTQYQLGEHVVETAKAKANIITMYRNLRDNRISAPCGRKITIFMRTCTQGQVPASRR